MEGHPAIILKPDLDSETILLRNTIDGRRQLQEYDNKIKTDSYRDNLKYINKCFIKHWPDLRIMDTEVSTLSNRIEKESDKEPIDLSSRTLVRVFSNGSFKQGGRFYRGWWQNIPSDYRKYITLDSKKTTEYDFSQLNPHMIYHRYGYELGSEDAYDRVFDGLHRDTVKEAFNAMIQASTPLRNCPTNINIDQLGISWTDLKERILDAHKPITDLFFKGLGNQLQFEDSCMAESVMLQFTKIDAPALPVHDSFIMHHGYGGELEEAMKRAYYERFNEDIKIKEEIIDEIQAPDIEKQTNLSFDDLVEGKIEYFEWQKRDRIWWANK